MHRSNKASIRSLGYGEKCGYNRQTARRLNQQYDAIIYKHACGRGHRVKARLGPLPAGKIVLIGVSMKLNRSSNRGIPSRSLAAQVRAGPERP